ncbi:MAG: hypothetical protein CMF71_09580 [Magnetovibrio sp.]|nr:hypothetical protein [Magnetovibrio sp.]
MTHNCKTTRQCIRIGLAVALLSSCAVVNINSASANANAGWKPSISERLVKLPSANIKKALDKDFSASPLADALRDTDAEISLKLRTLHDLQAAVDQADGEVQIELKHQFLAEKRDYITMVQEQHKMRGKYLKTRIKVYQRLLNKINRKNAAKTTAQSTLIEKQKAARERLERSAEMIDTKIFATSLSSESKYSEQYAANVSAINTLVAKIEAHPHRSGLDLSDDAKTKPDLLRQLLIEAEGDYQSLQQESEIVGLMAKLVALDAMGLQEIVTERDDIKPEPIGAPNIIPAVKLF